jgi:ABC-type cobalamin transport system permease subunit
MPPADAAPDPLDCPAAALAAELMAWCAARSPLDAGAWLPALPFGEWFDWQRDLARRLAAAVLATALATALAADDPDAGGRP